MHLPNMQCVICGMEKKNELRPTATTNNQKKTKQTMKQNENIQCSLVGMQYPYQTILHLPHEFTFTTNEKNKKHGKKGNSIQNADDRERIFGISPKNRNQIKFRYTSQLLEIHHHRINNVPRFQRLIIHPHTHTITLGPFHTFILHSEYNNNNNNNSNKIWDGPPFINIVFICGTYCNQFLLTIWFFEFSLNIAISKH